MAEKDKTKEPVIAEALERFEESEDATSFSRQASLEDTKFARLGEQWPDKIRKTREGEGRPVLTINKLPAFIRQVVNDSRQNKPAIAVHPVDNGADKDTAEVISGLIRSIERRGADVAYDTAIDHAASGGFGFFRIGIEYCHEDSFDKQAVIERIANPLMVHWDPTSTKFDASDWSYGFVSDFLTEDEFEQKYPKAKKVSFDGDDTRDHGAHWIDEEKIRVAEYWLREEKERTIYRLSDGMVVRGDLFTDEVKAILEATGVTVLEERKATYYEVTRRVISGVEVLKEEKWAGSTIPICPVWGEEIIVEGKRHFRSMIRDAKDPQTMFNFWRSATTELVALAPRAPWVGPKGFVPKGQEAKWQTANNRSHAYLEYEPTNGGGRPQREAFAGVPAGALQEALNASDDMKAIIGIYDSSLGARSNETSGRAIMARQREADVSNFHFIDNLSRAIQYAGKVLVEIIPSVYSARQTIRILGDDMKEKVVKLVAEGQQGGYGAQPMQDPQTRERLYDLSVGKYDVTVSTGPSFATQREETRETLVELMSKVPGSAAILGDVLIENMDFTGADKVSKRLQMLLPPAIQQAEGIQGVQPQQPQVNPLDDEEKKAKIESLRASAAKSMADAGYTQKSTELDAIQTVLTVLDALRPNPGASQAQPGNPPANPQTGGQAGF
jgi:hypothetical protein